MARAFPLLHSINSGEFSPRMEARLDFERYPNAAKQARNLLPYPQGGLTRRPGTRFVNGVKTDADTTILIPFEFSENTAYMIEHGDQYMRFYRVQSRIEVGDTDASITNGTFDSNINGWDDRSTGSAGITHDGSNNRLQLTGNSSGIAWAEQDVSVSAGNQNTEHVLYFQIEGFGGGKVGFQVGSSSTDDDVLSEVELEPGYHAIAFTPGATTFYIQFRNSTKPVRNMFINNVSLADDAPLELTSPYAKADLPEVRSIQIADVIYLFHEDYAPRKIERRGHTSWSIVEAFFKDGPYLPENPDTDLDERQILPNPFFENGYQGWGDGRTASSEAYVQFNPEDNTMTLHATGSDDAQLQLFTTVTVNQNEKHVLHVNTSAKEKGNSFVIKAGTSIPDTTYLDDDLRPKWQSFEFTTGANSDFGIQISDSYDEIDSKVGAVLLYDTSARLLEPNGTTGEVTITAHGFNPFRFGDVGRLLRLTWHGREPGYGVITAVSLTTSATLLVLRELPSTAPTERWQFGAWGGNQGYPRVVGMFDGRLVVANTTQKPQTIWLSQSADLENMRPDSFVEGATTVEDDDAIEATLNSKKIDPIFWLAGQTSLIVGTAGGEWAISSQDDVVTPAGIRARQQAYIPCGNIEPVGVNNVTIFTDKSEREAYDIIFDDVQQSFVPTELTILADHIFNSPVAEFAYQRRPYSVAWCRKDDGRIATLTYNRQHDVLGWTQQILGGSFSDGDPVVESIAVIPGINDGSQTNSSDERDEVWVVVKRTIDSSTVRYIEFFEFYYDGPLREDYDSEAAWRTAVKSDQQDAFYVDSGITYDSSATTTITGLDHLEGETVKVLADGKIHPDKTVSSGQITLDYEASKVQAGLGYTHKYESLKMAAGASAGTSVHRMKALTGAGYIVLDTAEFSVTTVDYDEDGRRQHDLITVNFFREDMVPGEAVPLFTGEKDESLESVMSNDARLYIEGDNPLPFSLIGIAPRISTGDYPSPA